MPKQPSYEEAMAHLHEIVQALESGEESLENSMKLFEEGARLSAFCYEKLEQARQKVSEFTAPPEEDPADELL